MTQTCRSVRLLLFALALVACGRSEREGQRLPISHEGSLVVHSLPELPTWPEEEWKRARRPEDMGWSSEGLDEARRFASTIGTDAFLIVDRGLIVQQWGEISEPFETHSIRKSLLSALVGIALVETELELETTLEEIGIDDEPPLSGEEKRARLVDLLTSRSGIYHAAAYESSAQAKNRPRRHAHEPGEHFYYNNWDFNALGSIVATSLGDDVFSLFDQRIARRLEMQDFSVKHTESRSDRSSQHPAYLFRMSARDLARFGLLYSRLGVWHDGPVLDRDWVRSSTEIQVPNATEHRNYGYLWWTYSSQYVASGSGGQKVVVIPDRDIVLVHLAKETRFGRGGVDQRQFWQLYGKILEAKSP